MAKKTKAQRRTDKLAVRASNARTAKARYRASLQHEGAQIDSFRESFDDEGTRYFGYDAPREPGESPFEITRNGLVCMAFQVTKRNIDELSPRAGHTYRVGEWFLSTGAHEDTVVHGPFGSVDAAMDLAKTEFGAVRFMSAPVWHR